MLPIKGLQNFSGLNATVRIHTLTMQPITVNISADVICIHTYLVVLVVVSCYTKYTKHLCLKQHIVKYLLISLTALQWCD